MKITCTISVLFNLWWMCSILPISEANLDGNLRLRNSNETWFTRNRLDALPEFSPKGILKEIDFNEFSNTDGLLSYFREKKIERRQMPRRQIQNRENSVSRIRAENERREMSTMERYRRDLSRNFRGEDEYRRVVERRWNFAVNPSKNERIRSKRFYRNERYEGNSNSTDSFRGRLFQFIRSYLAMVQSKISEICRCTFSLVIGMLIFDIMGHMIRIKPKEKGKGL